MPGVGTAEGYARRAAVLSGEMPDPFYVAISGLESTKNSLLYYFRKSQVQVANLEKEILVLKKLIKSIDREISLSAKTGEDVKALIKDLKNRQQELTKKEKQWSAYLEKKYNLDSLIYPLDTLIEYLTVALSSPSDIFMKNISLRGKRFRYAILADAIEMACKDLEEAFTGHPQKYEIDAALKSVRRRINSLKQVKR